MSSTTLTAGLRHLRGKLALQERREDSDEQLLQTFAAQHEDDAFAVLVRRHGPMVLHVCRRVLGHQQDAEDAFQATFLVLARSAASLRNKAALASWLHGTAYRTAMKAKQTAARRRKHEGQAASRPSAEPADELSWREVRTLLDEEITRLPEIYRSVFVLCCMESLSLAQAARHLGLKEGTVSSRLTAARKRLSRRLARRGVELTMLLAAMAVATETASALPVALTTSTIKAALAVSKGVTGAVSASVAALMENGSSLLSFGKAKLAMLAVTVSLLASGVALAPREAQPKEPAREPSRVADAIPLAQPGETPATKSAVYAGRVVDPEGKPVVGAKLYVLYYTPKELPIPVRAASDEDGRFRFTIPHKEFDQTSSTQPWDQAMVVATAKGYGLGLPVFPKGKGPRPTDWTLRLSKDDAPITGHIIDLQGKPIAGVAVHVHGLFWSPKEDLTACVADLKEKKEGYPVLRDHLMEMGGLWMGRDLGKIFSTVTTGADGRFRLPGVGRERIVALRLQGASIAAAELYAMTRPGETIRTATWQRGELGEQMTFCGVPFEHIAAPCQPIVGVVRDRDTGKPLAGAVVRSYTFAGPRIGLSGQTFLSTVTDKEGRYRLDGMPKRGGNEIRAEGPEGEPYVMSVLSVPKGFSLDPVTVDFQLKRGVWVHGKVTNKDTGEPVRSVVRCAVFNDNPYRQEARGLHFEDFLWNRAGDGTFRLVTLPGRGVITAQGVPNRYLTKVGADRIKGLDQLFLLEPYHTIVEINPDKDAKDVRCDIALDPGRSLSGTMLGPDGQPLAGVKIAGLATTGDWEYQPSGTAKFTVRALLPGETRVLQFAHEEKHLAGSLVLKGDAKGPLTVTLKPASSLKGRFVTPDGKPWANLQMFADLYGPIADPRMMPKLDPSIGTFPQGLRTGKDGSFQIENLAPGLKYRITLRKSFYVLTPDGPAGTGVMVGEGETKDLGDVTVKPFE